VIQQMIQQNHLLVDSAELPRARPNDDFGELPTAQWDSNLSDDASVFAKKILK